MDRIYGQTKTFAIIAIAILFSQMVYSQSEFYSDKFIFLHESDSTRNTKIYTKITPTHFLFTFDRVNYSYRIKRKKGNKIFLTGRKHFVILHRGPKNSLDGIIYHRGNQILYTSKHYSGGLIKML